MMTEENARVAAIRRMMARWPAYRVIGNRPYAKGCYLVRRGLMVDGRYAPPEVVLATERNYDMHRVVEHPHFNPWRAVELAERLGVRMIDRPVVGGLLDPVAPDYRPLRRNLCAKAFTLLEEGIQLAELFVDPAVLKTQPTGITIDKLRDIWRQQL